MQAQRERYRAVGVGAIVVERSPRRIAIRLADEVADKLVQETVAIERACCPFFELTWEPEEHRLTVAVTRAEEEPALDAITYALGLGQLGDQSRPAPRSSQSC